MPKRRGEAICVARSRRGCYHTRGAILAAPHFTRKGTSVARCDVCAKTTGFGRNIRHKHSGRWERKAPRTNRTFKANIQNKTFVVDGVPIRVKICTRCLRSTLKSAV
jgi:large subunit ribosomal protein L28